MKNPFITPFSGLWKTGIVSLAIAGMAFAQPAVELPRSSPKAAVSQTFGYTQATVTYSRPAVNERVIWGGLVPYGKVWRAGANEATTVEFNTDVKVNGQNLPKGKYSLHILPTEAEWTFIFNSEAEAWGSYSYKEDKDALRVKVKPSEAPHKERLEFGFEDLNDSSATFYAHWEKRKADLNLVVEVVETAKAKIKAGLPNAKADDPYAPLGAARFYWAHNVDRKQAMEWVDKSIKVKPIRANLWAKAEMLADEKKFKDAKKSAKLAREAAVKDGDEAFVAILDNTVAGWEKDGKKDKKKDDKKN